MSGLIIVIYFVLAIFLFIGMNMIIDKYNITKVQGILLSLLYILLLGGCFSTFRVFSGDVFIILIFYMIIDIVHTTYILGDDFFGKGRFNYHLILIIVGYLLNNYFINQVDSIFLSPDQLKIVIWLIVIISLYKFINNNKMFNTRFISNNKLDESDIRIQYTKYKNKYNLKYEDKDLELLLYSIMIIYNKDRNNLLRWIDYKIFEFTGRKRKLSIMLIESDKMISDEEGIDIVYKELSEIKKNTKSIVTIINKYDKDHSNKIMYVYNTLKDFLK